MRSGAGPSGESIRGYPHQKTSGGGTIHTLMLEIKVSEQSRFLSRVVCPPLRPTPPFVRQHIRQRQRYHSGRLACAASTRLGARALSAAVIYSISTQNSSLNVEQRIFSPVTRAAGTWRMALLGGQDPCNAELPLSFPPPTTTGAEPDPKHSGGPNSATSTPDALGPRCGTPLVGSCRSCTVYAPGGIAAS